MVTAYPVLDVFFKLKIFSDGAYARYWALFKYGNSGYLIKYIGGYLFWWNGSYDFKERLKNYSSHGMTGNSLDSEFIGDLVYIQPLYGDDPEEYRVSIDRQKLIK